MAFKGLQQGLAVTWFKDGYNPVTALYPLYYLYSFMFVTNVTNK